jgi:glycosyltransferase involved in cell wall biosynthesis
MLKTQGDAIFSHQSSAYADGRELTTPMTKERSMEPKAQGVAFPICAEPMDGGIETLTVGRAGNKEAGVTLADGKVSVIIPTYNAAAFLQECVESVLNQTYTNIEILVVDDGSTDNTQAVLAPYISKNLIKYIYQPNQGQGRARNLAIRNSSGEFVAFLDADDLWASPQKLEKQIALLRQNERVGLVYSDAIYFGESWERQKQASRKLRDYENRKAEYFRHGDTYKSLVKFNYIVTSSVLVRRSILEKTGVFWVQVRFCEDLHLWLRIAMACEMDFSPEGLVKRRFHQGQVTHDKRRGYREACYLYRYLLLQQGFPEKLVIMRIYGEYMVKRMVAWALRW